LSDQRLENRIFLIKLGHSSLNFSDMNGQRGQASILIAIIFQVLFIFFAMVVNVGLLVHDKINLQNSTDIAAYYGAMKQAEVLNAMAQTNYQIRQAYKLLVWRLWVLGDAGRNTSFNPSPSGVPPDQAEDWRDDKLGGPSICLANPFWKESQKNTLCKTAYFSTLSIQPLKLTPFQVTFVLPSLIFAKTISDNATKFSNSFKSWGPVNYGAATSILASYKMALFNRRVVMKQLQDLLIKGTNDFSDITGASVSATVTNTLKKNLTAANNSGLDDVEFSNGLGGKPFLVPIDVRVWLYYQDFKGTSSTQSAMAKQINEPAFNDGDGTVNGPLYQAALQFFTPDYSGQPTLESAQQFAQEQAGVSNQNAFNSLVGFEKNPWVLAYVYVKATTHPKMLFSPFTSDSKNPVTLTAEAYAMPFGGKMGPWYKDTWPSGAPESSGNKIDNLLPPRRDDSSVVQPTVFPNYSRYPGDPLGMKSKLARYVELSQMWSLKPSVNDYLQIGTSTSDPVIASPTSTNTLLTRPFEMRGIWPDLFDATYYSADYDFPARFNGKDNYLTTMCTLPCFDLGSQFAPMQQLRMSIEMAMGQAFQKSSLAFWGLKVPAHLNSSWSQGDPGQYDSQQAQLSAGQTWENTNPPGGAGAPAGGRAGYSVKLVSKSFLTRSDLPLGGNGNPGPIANPPTQ
jgi:hypothetical protein